MMQNTRPAAPRQNTSTVVAPTPPPAPVGGGVAQSPAGTPTAALANTNAAPEVELTPEQMETALLAGIQITADDLRGLMVQRAHSVQAALAKTGKVEGARMSVLSPRLVSLTAKGQARATLALD